MQQRKDRRPAWLAMVPVLWLATSACGGVEGASSLGSLEQTDDGTTKEGDGSPTGDPNEEKGIDPGEKDPGDHDGKCDDGTGAGDPIPTCADKGLACAVIVDKEHLCADGLAPIWELACGDNEVCCGPPLEEGTADPGEEKPTDPNAGDPSDPSEPSEAGK